MMNPFASYDIFLPRSYKDRIDKFTKTSGRREGPLISPFARQVDLWYTAFLYAMSAKLDPEKEQDTYKVISAQILSQDPYRVPFIQIAILGYYGDAAILTDPKKMLDLAMEFANAGLPYVVNILDDPDEDKPLWALLGLYEEQSGRVVREMEEAQE